MRAGGCIVLHGHMKLGRQLTGNCGSVLRALAGSSSLMQGTAILVMDDSQFSLTAPNILFPAEERC